MIANLVRSDPARRVQLIDQVRAFRDTVFSRETQQTVWKPLIDQMEALLVGFGVPNAPREIATVRQQLRLARIGRLSVRRAASRQSGLRPQG